MERVVRAAKAWTYANDAAINPPYVSLTSHEWTRMLNELNDSVAALSTLPRAPGGEGGQR